MGPFVGDCARTWWQGHADLFGEREEIGVAGQFSQYLGHQFAGLARLSAANGQ